MSELITKDGKFYIGWNLIKTLFRVNKIFTINSKED